MSTILTCVETYNFQFQEALKLIVTYLCVPDLNGYLCSERSAYSFRNKVLYKQNIWSAGCLVRGFDVGTTH
jgi:hypothetical protein